MCNLTTITLLVGTLNLFIAGSVIFLAAAMIANGSIFGAGAAPLPILGALGLAAIAAAEALIARDHVSGRCLQCSVDGPALVRALNELVLLLAAYVVSLSASLVVVAIPVVGTIAIGVAIAALVLITASAIRLPQKVESLAICMNQQDLGQRVFVIATAAVFILTVVFLIVLVGGVPGIPGLPATAPPPLG